MSCASKLTVTSTSSASGCAARLAVPEATAPGQTTRRGGRRARHRSPRLDMPEEARADDAAARRQRGPRVAVGARVDRRDISSGGRRRSRRAHARAEGAAPSDADQPAPRARNRRGGQIDGRRAGAVASLPNESGGATVVHRRAGGHRDGQVQDLCGVIGPARVPLNGEARGAQERTRRREGTVRGRAWQPMPSSRSVPAAARFRSCRRRAGIVTTPLCRRSRSGGAHGGRCRRRRARGRGPTEPRAAAAASSEAAAPPRRSTGATSGVEERLARPAAEQALPGEVAQGGRRLRSRCPSEACLDRPEHHRANAGGCDGVTTDLLAARRRREQRARGTAAKARAERRARSSAAKSTDGCVAPDAQAAAHQPQKERALETARATRARRGGCGGPGRKYELAPPGRAIRRRARANEQARHGARSRPPRRRRWRRQHPHRQTRRRPGDVRARARDRSSTGAPPLDRFGERHGRRRARHEPLEQEERSFARSDGASAAPAASRRRWPSYASTTSTAFTTGGATTASAGQQPRARRRESSRVARDGARSSRRAPSAGVDRALRARHRARHSPPTAPLGNSTPHRPEQRWQRCTRQRPRRRAPRAAPHAARARLEPSASVRQPTSAPTRRAPARRAAS